MRFEVVMSRWVALSKEQHKNAGWKKFSHYLFAKSDAVAPVLLAELSHVIPYYPLSFTRTAQGSFQLVVVQSLQTGLNLYVNKEGRWLAPYVPSVYRGYPFMLIAQEDQWVLCVDETAQNFHDEKMPGDTALFVDNELSEELKSVLNFHNSRVQNQKLTTQVVEQLNQADLIVPWTIQLKTSPEETGKTVDGLFKIDETKLKTLSPETLTTLNSSGALGLAYAQLLSQVRLNDFGQRYEYFNKMHQQPVDVDLDKLFGEDDDSLKF